MTGQRMGRETNKHEAGRKYSDEEPLLYGREEDHGQGADAPFRGLPAAEGIRIYQFVEQSVTRQFVRPRHHEKLDRMNIPAACGEHWGEVENSHEAIISAETFERAQQELERRAKKVKPRAKAPQHIFTSLIHCGLCGKRFHRGIVKNKSTKPVWVCSTSYTYGKNTCPAQRIPEHILLDKTSEALGIDELSRESLLEHITEILVPGHNRLVYVFRDGHTQGVTWQHPSRRAVWTAEMRQKARENALKREERKRKNDETH